MAIHATIRGTAFGRIDQPKDKFSEAKDGSRLITRTYRTLWIGWLSAAPSRGSAHPTYPLAKLENRVAEQITPGYLCEVTLTYRQPEEEATPEPGAQLPPNRYSQSATDIETSIEAHPNFATFATEDNGAIWNPVPGNFVQRKFGGWAENSPYNGYMTYKAGSVAESETTYFWSRPGGVETLVGTKSGNWLTVSGSIQKEGIYWSRTINRIYNSAGWPAGIYS